MKPRHFKLLWWALLGLVLAVAAPMQTARAHEVRPAYLQIDELGPGKYEMLWRTPILSGMRLPVALTFSDDVDNLIQPSEQELSDSLLERRVIGTGPDGLAGKRIEFVGLQATITDVLVRVQLLDGTSSTTLVHPSRPWIEVATSQGPLTVAQAYVAHGIQHILFGVDHLLFVFGLLLLVKNRWMLVKTITSFTLAHSITLTLATLDYINIPSPPIEAGIALSILFLGVEIMRAWRGGTSLAIRHPWIVAFAFGLLHGLGFATGLKAIGLPQSDIPLALFFFNVGVELGQLGFVIVVLLLERVIRLLRVRWPRAIELVPAYTVGSLAAFWTIERVVAMIGSPL
jgi:hydrogenase/urease accessory protein HupE